MQITNQHLLLKKVAKFPFVILPDREIVPDALAWEDLERIFTGLVRFMNLVFCKELMSSRFAYLELSKLLEDDSSMLAAGNVVAVHKFLLQHFPSSLFSDLNERRACFALFNKAEGYVRPVFATLLEKDRQSVLGNFLEAFTDYLELLFETMGLRVVCYEDAPAIWNTAAVAAGKDHPLLFVPSRDGYIDLHPFLIAASGHYYLWQGKESPRAFYDGSGNVVEMAEDRVQPGLFDYYELFLLTEKGLALLGANDSRFRTKALLCLANIKLYWAAAEYEKLVREISEYKFCCYKLNNNRIEDRNHLLDYLNAVGLLHIGKEGEAVLELKKLIHRVPAMFYPYRELQKLYEKSGYAGDAARLRQALPELDLLTAADEPAGVLPYVVTRRPVSPQGKSDVPRELIDLKQKVLELAPLVIGRERECLEIIEILCCMNRNNCMLVGDPGVGKTSVIYQVVNKLLRRDVPEQLQDVPVYELNVAATFADAGPGGQLEKKIEALLSRLAAENGILVIDDIHSISSGNAYRSGSMNFPSLLKPFLERKNTRVIATTSYEDYLKSVGTIPVFARLFQRIDLRELPLNEVATILKIKAQDFAGYHRVAIDIDAVCENLEIVKQFFRDRLLPDKAIELLDRTCARISLRPQALDGGPPRVTVTDFLQTIADDRGVELSSISTSLRDKLIRLEDALKERIIGQDEVIRRLSKKIIPARTGLKVNRFRPDAVFLFLGPTGVGKTETARILARSLYGSDEKFLRIDMSEFMEEYSVSKLIGSAPGYVGYEDQNQLIDEIRKDPYRLLLLDEIEKAHPALINIFLQVFDSGVLTDAKGKKAYFDKTVIVMTSNVGAALFSQDEIGFWQGSTVANRVSKTAHAKELKRFFKPEFLNRIDEIITFNALSFEDAKRIARLNIDLINRRFSGNLKIHVSASVIDFLARRGFSQEYGARELLRVIQDEILQKIAKLRLHADAPIAEVHVSYHKRKDRLIFKHSGGKEGA